MSTLTALTDLDLSGCGQIYTLEPLSELRSLKSLEFTSGHVTSIEPLRNIVSLEALDHFSPAEVAELLAHAACMRKDRVFIQGHAVDFLAEVEEGVHGPQVLHERFAATLGEAFSLLGESSVESAYEKFLTSYPYFSSTPWKAWFGGTLTESGFGLYRQRVERTPLANMVSGAIGGACATLPFVDEPDWSSRWLAQLEKMRLSDARTLLAVAPEICLAYARVGEMEGLWRWLREFTDPNEAAATDPLHAAFARYQIKNGGLEAATKHIFAIETVAIRDPILAILVSVLADTNLESASTHLLLIQTDSLRMELALRLATKLGSSDATIYRLVIATGDSPGALAELMKTVPDPAPHIFLSTLSRQLQSDRKNTLRRMAELYSREAEQRLAEAAMETEDLPPYH
ncbi:MAG: hypothetical protein ORN83_09640 [Chthoniobacteraceae bacterium]|nr:hypothetical protein [Chthoniobacteraceae bacterium]